MASWRQFGCLVLAVLVLPAGRSAAAEKALLRVMTFNLRYATAADGANSWKHRKEILLETIRQFGPHLLGTQEMLALQGDYLTENLPGYKLVGVGRDDGQRQGEFSAILFQQERFELVDSGTFWLSETPDKVGSKSWDSSLPRIATWVRLRDRNNEGREMCYLNTHWDHRGNQARVESGKIIRGWLAQHAAQVPAVVTGDLNVTDDHPGYRALVAADGPPPLLHDVFRQAHPAAGPDEATFHNFAGSRKGRRIDFILATPELMAVDAAIDHTNRDGRYPSDHYPVTAVLRMTQVAE
jgi:endonuclease/exonuclease/phosphatase family metal-dependent hydrolase